MKKLLSMLLAGAMLVSSTAMAFAESAGAAEKGTIVYGSSTEIGGDFAPAPGGRTTRLTSSSVT